MVPSTSPQTLILYDGVCALCNWTVQFLLRHDRLRARPQNRRDGPHGDQRDEPDDDRRGHFLFAPLQSAAARSLLQRHGLDAHGLDADWLNTVCVVANYGEASERLLTKSSAALYAAGQLGGLWKLSAAGYAIPPVLRDAVYALAARYRYRLFGKYETCPLPAPLDRDKFIGL